MVSVFLVLVQILKESCLGMCSRSDFMNITPCEAYHLLPVYYQ